MQSSIRRVGIFVGLPIAAVALAVFLLSWGNGSGQKAHAAVDPAVNFNLSASGCNTDGTSAKCTVAAGSTFTVTFNVTGQPTTGWAGYDMKVAFSGSINYSFASVQYLAPAANCTSHPTAATGFEPTTGTQKGTAHPTPTPGDQFGNGTMATGCSGDGANHLFTGAVLSFDMVCKTSGTGTLSLVHGDGSTDLVTSDFVSHSEAAAPATEALTINCVPATNTPTPLPTATPPPIPRVQKLPAIQNVFLTRQGAKIPPATCEAGTNAATLSEGLNQTIVSQDPKGRTGFQVLAAFEFEVRFDSKLVCVSVAPGPNWGGGSILPQPVGSICSTVTAKGLVRFGCVSVGKCPLPTAAPTPVKTQLCHSATGRQLATISVRPQPFLVNSLRPNQDNGIPVQIMNQGCQLSDEQGHSIPIFSCESADVTFRMLEGDVDGPNCTVNVLDAQDIAFRWGAGIGSLLYNSFLDLSPSGQIKGDGRIDINDLQFVFGRLGSTCQNPWPPQLPVNPKA